MESHGPKPVCPSCFILSHPFITGLGLLAMSVASGKLGPCFSQSTQKVRLADPSGLRIPDDSASEAFELWGVNHLTPKARDIAPASFVFFGLGRPGRLACHMPSILTAALSARPMRPRPKRIANIPNGCGSKIGAGNGTLESGNMDYNLWSPGGLMLTHTIFCMLISYYSSLVICVNAFFPVSIGSLRRFPPCLRSFLLMDKNQSEVVTLASQISHDIPTSPGAPLEVMMVPSKALCGSKFHLQEMYLLIIVRSHIHVRGNEAMFGEAIQVENL